jgi:hypothetical protein
MPVYDELYKFKLHCIMCSYVMEQAQRMLHKGTQNSRRKVGVPLQLRDQEQQI